MQPSPRSPVALPCSTKVSVGQHQARRNAMKTMRHTSRGWSKHRRRVRREARVGDRRGERGVTMLLVAVAMVSIVAMAALAIDVITLYVAKVEAQRAADAAAMAGAKALVAGGVTGDPSNAFSTWQSACGIAAKQAQAVAEMNSMGGAVLTESNISISFPNAPSTTDCSGSNQVFGINPQIQVVVQRQDLPVFFARIFARSASTITATATAEALNPSNSSSVSADGTTIPISPRCVKPWLIPNLDPNHVSTTTSQPMPFVDTVSGAIINRGSHGGVIGEGLILQPDCGTPGCVFINPPTAGLYLPAYAPPDSNNYCPLTVGSSDYEQAIACCSNVAYTCGANGAQADLTTQGATLASYVQNGVMNLIAGGAGSGQDTLLASSPLQVLAGAGSPLVQSGVVSTGDQVTSSLSIVTVPIYDGATILVGTSQPPVNVVGFAQLFLEDADSSGKITATVLNVSGCIMGAVSLNPPIIGGGVSSVPVRLITH